MAKHLTDEQFIEILTSSQVRLRAFAISMVRPRSDADDVLQNACMTLWKERGKYDADRDFFPWAYGVVLNNVLRHRKKKATDKLLFNDALICTLATEYVDHADEFDLRRQLLHACIAKLNNKDRGLLEERYTSSIKPKIISQQRSWPLSSVYSSLSRIRVLLHRCIETKLVQQSRS
ncbi:MAG: sigma-70 family RNA polymerase sigma factor [Planctomycetes bacterium]|nr:sigma-70 family RNA polymerase sigma factor [Planctomycetota bacterium]